MTTAELIIARLPNTPTVSPADIQAAANLKTPCAVMAAIQEGRIDAVKIGGRYIVSRESAVKFIQKCAEEIAK